MRRQADDAHPTCGQRSKHLLMPEASAFRPTLALLTGQMLGAPSVRLITLAAAVELLHTATLVPMT